LRHLRLADALYAAPAVILLHLAWVNLNADSFLRPIVALSLKGEAAKTPVLKEYAAIDKAFASFSEKGNVFLRFAGFNPHQKVDHDFLELYYYRAVYAAYPRRVYSTDPHDAITQAADIAKFAFAPDDQWLNTHQVGTIATFRMAEKGQVVQEAITRAW
jgi:hypothetical protein